MYKVYTITHTHTHIHRFDLDDDLAAHDQTQDLTSTRGQSPMEEPCHLIHPQPAVLTTRINERDVVRTTDIRVSERTPLADLRLKEFDPIYNELTGEVHVYVMQRDLFYSIPYSWKLWYGD